MYEPTLAQLEEYLDNIAPVNKVEAKAEIDVIEQAEVMAKKDLERESRFSYGAYARRMMSALGH